ncbi:MULTISPECIES: hypothetical protein [Rhodococcus]|uniref:hypothetical protein n=1 Tax=Rhodococcus TaxID=1827 RepID=UPI00295352D5|nr:MULTISPECIES: hypothetical protein [Rhodococcus]MDV7246348.1 hypothetical protein [Rhodococcus oxybenzonivorans]MDV7337370.1 hypothetical protein [Rhodococcus oxybenzonivorans]MDV7347999.1 hypothetical protein [Rhodococcus oxybenzonivorans]MDV8031651.1 hypothetical protein [Rhodococcus sp. IEGM 27]
MTNGPLREILAKHRPSYDHASCTACGFVYTPDLPLCPPVADALRELSTGAVRPQDLSLGRYTSGRLRAMAREHTGEGRCRRCGFVYAGQVRLCPTSRRIAAELETRGQAPATQPHTGQGLCVGKGSGWTVTSTKAAAWKRAMAACSVCPLLAQCERQLEDRLASGVKVREQIMAGRLFTVTGREVEAAGVDAFAVSRGRTKKKQQQQKPQAPKGIPSRPATRTREVAA